MNQKTSSSTHTPQPPRSPASALSASSRISANRMPRWLIYTILGKLVLASTIVGGVLWWAWR